MLQKSYTVKGKSNIKFDDVGKLDRPKIDDIITWRLNDATIAYANAFSDTGKLYFVYSVNALIKISKYYWLYNQEFQEAIGELNALQRERLRQFPPGEEINPTTGIRKIDIRFAIAEKKFDEVITVITTSSKAFPIYDEA